METRARALIAAAALCVAGTAVAAFAFAAEAPRRAILVVARDDGLWRVRDDGRSTLLRGTAGARAPSWAPSGRELAFERDGTTYALNADGSGRRPVLAGRDPDWSPDGRSLVVEHDGTIVVARRNGEGAQRVTSGPADRQPAWSPDGRRIAFARDGVISVVVLSTGAVSAVARGTDPAWSPDGRQLAFATDGGIATVRLDTGELRLHTVDGADSAPLFSPDGSEIGVVHAGNIIAVAPDGGAPRTVTPGTAADWAYVPTSDELLPDLDQRPPANVAVAFVGGRYRIGFASAVDNVGRGPLWIRGVRDGASMRARQLVRTSAGRVETHRDAGTLRYTWSTTHSHWHYLAFERYELRRLSDNALVARDRKTGFCLADHYGHALRVRPGPPVFLGRCGTGNPRLRAVEQGSSRGYTDRYPAHYHGQNLDVTGVPEGVYVLVHRANPHGILRERSYDNNAASVRIRLSRAGGAPRVRVLRTCATTARC